MTLSINDLKVGGYVSPLTDLELVEMKGGVVPAAAWLTYVAVAAAVTAAGAVVVACVTAANDHKECGTRETKFTNPDGSVTTVTDHICRE